MPPHEKLEKARKSSKNEEKAKKVGKRFGDYDKNHYLCTRFKELSNTAKAKS